MTAVTMKARYGIAFACATSLVAGRAALASPTLDPPLVSCPDKVAPPRAGALAPEGWQIHWDDSMESLLDNSWIVSAASLQSRLTVLKPATRYRNMDKKWPEQKIEKIWTLPPAKVRQPLWIFCEYRLSAVKLFRLIPVSAQSCKITARYEGNPSLGPPMTIQCR